MLNKSPFAFVFCALNCEAKPLVETWKLTKQSDTQSFTCYADDQRVVTVTGVGKIAMAGAVGYVMARHSSQNPILLNFGIAGHPHLPRGSRVLADKISDSETGRTFYPKFVFDLPCPTAQLISYPKIATHYQDDGLYDMESSGFYELATRFSSSELVHCLKVVSDNRDNSVANIGEADVLQWSRQAVPFIADLLERLISLRSKLEQPDLENYREILRQWHFSTSNALKLRSLLLRWQVLHSQQDQVLQWRQANARTGKQLLIWLEKQLEEGDFEL